MSRWQESGYQPSPSFLTGSLSLPPELDIRSTIAPPIYKPLSWNQQNEDLILLAEFSEIEGPVPLVTIPQSQPHHVDVNNFVVKVMSTDYLNTSGEFRVCPDTQMVQQDIEPGLHVYVHYFTLYDVRARGFVRPMCLSYISSDSRKLLHYFSELRHLFSEATEYLKWSNLCWFTNEMQGLIADLEYTKDRYIQIQRRLSFEMESKHESHEALTWHPNGEEGRQRSSQGEDKDRKEHDAARDSGIALITSMIHDSTTHQTHSLAHDWTPVAPSQTNDNQKCCKISVAGGTKSLSLDGDEENLVKHTTLEAVAMQLMECQHILDIVKPHLSNKEISEDIQHLIEEVRSKPDSPLHRAMTELSIFELPKHVPEPTICVWSMMKRNFRDLRCIEHLCGPGYILSLAKLQAIYERISKPCVTLMFENIDREVCEYPLGSLFVGSIPVVNVNKRKDKNGKAGITKSYSSLCWDQHFSQSLNRAQLSTTESQSNNGLEVSKELPEVSTAADCLEVFPIMDTKHLTKNAQSTNSELTYEDSNSSNQVTLLQDAASSRLNQQGRIQHSTSSSSSSSSSGSWSSIPFPDISGFEEIEEEEGVQEDAMVLGEQSIPYRDINERMLNTKACRLSGLMQQFCGVSHCLVHSLLSGRPVVLAAAEQYRSLVILYARALSTVLPRSPYQKLPVLRWHTGTLTEYHMKNYQVMGLCIPERLHVQDLMSNSTLNQVTVLNIETGHISGVAYGGTLVRGVEQYVRKLFHSNSALQTAVQAILVNLGLKIYLLYHLLRTTNRSANDILKGIGVCKGDWDIVRNLTSIIHKQEKPV